MVSNMKKVLIMVPTLQMGGQENVASKTANLLKNNYDISLLVFDNSNQVFFPDCEIININIPATTNPILKIFNILKRALVVYKIKSKGKFDFSISFGSIYGSNIINVLSKGKEKVIINIRSYTPKLLSPLAKLLYYYSDSIILCSEELKQILIDRFSNLSDKIFVLNNPYDSFKIIQSSDELVTDYDFNCKTIVSHGRFVPLKNHEKLIRAFSIARSKLNNIQLLLIGDGECKSYLEELAKKLNVSDFVSIIGYRTNPYSYLSKSSLFILSSNSEGFPNSLVEAMFLLPVISTDCKTGPREILTKNFNPLSSCTDVEYADYGVLVPTSSENSLRPDYEILSDAIITMLTDENLYEDYKKLAFKRACTYDMSTYTTRLISLLEHS